MKQRLDYVDYIKGFAALLVAIGHLVARNTELHSEHSLHGIIYSFHMPLFFFISGYVLDKTNKITEQGGWNFLKRRINTIFIPYLFWIFIAKFFAYNEYPHNMEELLDMLNFYPVGYYWFLPLLMIFMAIYLFRYNIEHLFKGKSIYLWRLF